MSEKGVKHTISNSQVSLLCRKKKKEFSLTMNKTEIESVWKEQEPAQTL